MLPVFIYTLVDSSNPDTIRYVGKTQNLQSRRSRHKSPYYLKEGTYKSNWVRSVLNAGNDIILEVVDTVNENNWQYWETYWICRFKAWGYPLTNTTTGGERIRLTPEILAKRNKSNTGRKFSPETIEKIRQKNLGRVISEEQREKLRQANLGKVYSQETKDKLSKMRQGEGNHFYGKTHTAESIELMRLNHPLRREIEQYTKEGKLLATHISSHEAQAATGCDRSHIMKCCKGMSRQAYGFIWKFKE